MMSKPSVLVIGPMKAGTTWVHDYLASRGDVCLPKGVKETYYFDRRFDKKIEWYRSHFKHCDSRRHKLTIEIAPSYFHNPDVPERIRKYLGPVQLIATLRNPVLRSWSHYLHMRRYGYTTAPLKEAVIKYPVIIDASRYLDHLRTWWKAFGRERVHILFQEELSRNADAYADKICQLLGLEFKGLKEENRKRANESAVSPSSTLAATARYLSNILKGQRLYFLVNAGKRLGLNKLIYGSPGNRSLLELTNDDRTWMANLFKPQIIELEKELNVRLDEWKNSMQ